MEDVSRCGIYARIPRQALSRLTMPIRGGEPTGGKSVAVPRRSQRSAQIVRTLPRALSEFGGTDELDQLPGIGPDLAAKIDELLRTGKLRSLQQLSSQVPAGLRTLLQLPGLGPIRVRALHTALGITGKDDLKRALAVVRGLTICRTVARFPAVYSGRNAGGDCR